MVKMFMKLIDWHPCLIVESGKR